MDTDEFTTADLIKGREGYSIRTVVCDCGNDGYHKANDWNNGDKPIWICDNCNTITNRRVRR